MQILFLIQEFYLFDLEFLTSGCSERFGVNKKAKRARPVPDRSSDKVARLFLRPLPEALGLASSSPGYFWPPKMSRFARSCKLFASSSLSPALNEQEGTDESKS